MGFYDTSRNGGGRWCAMEACGNAASGSDQQNCAI
ncbi:CGNR zinc finger domain-containing protein [Actinoplanes sp. NPDC051411]